MTKKNEKSRLYLIADNTTQNWVTDKQVSVSIDEITIIAPMSLKLWERYMREWVSYPFVKLSGAGLKVIDLDNCYFDDYGKRHEIVKPEQVAYIEMPKYRENEIRIDFNPNHGMQSSSGKWLKNILEQLPHKHFSRLDIAIDLINCPEVTNYDFWQYGMTKQVYYSRQQKVETKYWGSRASQKQVRLYDKKVEQEKRHGKIINLDSWWRLEFQLRGKVINNYSELVQEMLSNFCIPNYKNPNLTDNEQNKILRMMVDKEYYGNQSKSTQQRLRKLIRLSEPDNSLSGVLQTAFNDNLSTISKELDYYLDYFDIDNKKLPTING